MLGVFTRKASRVERQLAWRAQVVVASRAPFLGRAERADPETHVGSAVYDSEAVAKALQELAFGVNPNRPFLVTLIGAAREVDRLADLRPSWIDYCNKRSSLVPEATDAASELSRQYVNGDAVRAWPKFAQAQAAVGPAAEALRKLQQELADFCGSDITAGPCAA
ncbi:hypothetical protein ACGFYZ_40285 [Streptomyces sp. NPDC048330]|uniref:hypothetical protein n=1 Tax=Streptomyces sp. NPDC048330 TaxID=3365533 RepID=UPI003713852F